VSQVNPKLVMLLFGLGRVDSCLAAASLLRALLAYDLGQDITLCWRSNVSEPGSTIREDCRGAEIVVGRESLADPLMEQVEYHVAYEITIPVALGVQHELPHCNVHSCLRRVGFCTPFVKNSPGLSTHSPELSDVVLDSSGRGRAVSALSLGAGEYTIIAHVRWFDSDGIKHDMARAAVRDVEPVAHIAVYMAVSLAGVVAVAVLVALFCGAVWAVRRHRQLVAIETGIKNERKERVARALLQTQQLAYPMCLISYSHFKTFGRLIVHEEARSQGILRVLDTLEDVRTAAKHSNIIFVSHQWIGEGEPDFEFRHFRSVCSAVEALRGRCILGDILGDEATTDVGADQCFNSELTQFTDLDLDVQQPTSDCSSLETTWTTRRTDSLTTPTAGATVASKWRLRMQSDDWLHSERDSRVSDDETWIWIDYTSIPQRITTLQLLAIHSLFTYAGLSTYFLMVTPSVRNGITGQSYDLGTYLQRGWCRVECWARFSQSAENVYVVLGNGDDESFRLKPALQEPAVFQDCMSIFSACFTDERDKKRLVDTVVALYWQTLQREENLEGALKMVFRQMQASKGDYFPRPYFMDLIEITENLSKETDFCNRISSQGSFTGVLEATTTCRMCNGTGVV